MSTRKRNRRIDDVEYSLTSRKLSKTKDTTHTGTVTTDAGFDLSGNTVNMDENNSVASSAEMANDSAEHEHNSNSVDDSFLDLSTEEILRSTDVLIAEIREFRRDMNANTDTDSGQSNSDDTIILTDVAQSNEPETNGATVSNASTSATTSATTSTTTPANESGAGSAIDDSIVVIDDPRTVRPIVRDEDEDVIFVTESRREQRFRTIATIDLCDTPDTSFTQSNKQSDQAGAAATASTAAAPNNLNSPPPKPGTAKCPICLDSFGFDEIMSTMCGHLFCEPCIRNTIKTRKKCPMCNRSLKMNQIHRIFLGT